MNFKEVSAVKLCGMKKNHFPAQPNQHLSVDAKLFMSHNCYWLFRIENLQQISNSLKNFGWSYKDSCLSIFQSQLGLKALIARTEIIYHPYLRQFLWQKTSVPSSPASLPTASQWDKHWHLSWYKQQTLVKLSFLLDQKRLREEGPIEGPRSPNVHVPEDSLEDRRDNSCDTIHPCLTTIIKY